MTANGNHGGRRPGAGRKHGAKTTRTRIVATQLAKREMTPLHILVDTMVAFWEEAQRTVEPQPKLALMKEACAVAAQAAPYLHAKLTNVNATVRKVTSIKELSDDELIALAASVGGDEEGEEVVGEGAELVH